MCPAHLGYIIQPGINQGSSRQQIFGCDIITQCTCKVASLITTINPFNSTARKGYTRLACRIPTFTQG